MIAALVLLATLVAAGQASAVQAQSTAMRPAELECQYKHSTMFPDMFPICLISEAVPFVTLVPETISEIFNEGVEFIKAVIACGPKPECVKLAVQDLLKHISATKKDVIRKIKFYNYCINICH